MKELRRWIRMRHTTPASRALQRRQMEDIRRYVRPQLRLKHKVQKGILQGHDKIFASVWLDDRQVLVGTKDNRLIQLDLSLATAHELPLLPTVSPANFTAKEKNDTLSIHLKQPQAFEPFTPPQPLSRRFFAKRPACEGVRSLALNPSHTLLAAATADPPAITLYSRDLQTARRTRPDEHADAVFGVAWIDNTHLLSGSRDGTVAVYEHPTCLNDGLPGGLTRTWTSRRRGKVRAVAVHPAFGPVTLNAAGFVELWDAQHGERKQKLVLPHVEELVCLAADNATHGWLTVGSRDHMTFLDPRANSVVDTVSSPDGPWGVRALDMGFQVLTCGTGAGTIAFYDVRARAFHETSFLLGHHQAVYSLNYSPDDARLFAAGGPLATAQRGCSAAVWH